MCLPMYRAKIVSPAPKAAATAAHRAARDCASPIDVMSDLVVDKAVLEGAEEACEACDGESAPQRADHQDADAHGGLRVHPVAPDGHGLRGAQAQRAGAPNPNEDDGRAQLLLVHDHEGVGVGPALLCRVSYMDLT